MKCTECKFFQPWANGESGECRIKLPSWVQPRPERREITIGGGFVVQRTDGCDLGQARLVQGQVNH